jgi:hypothetical protein
MRYLKGSVNLSLKRDKALLKQVLDCGIVTQRQLWEFMLCGGQEVRRRSFNWRVKRLVDNGFIERQSLPQLTSSYVYSLAEAGTRELINVYECHAGAAGFYKRESDCESVVHALDLNDLHLALARAGILSKWQSEREIRSRNEFTGYSLTKDYDAVMALRVDGREVEIALEYERSTKADAKYVEIASKIRQERQVHRFLYLLPDYHMLWHIHRFFKDTGRKMYFGIACDFKRELLATRAIGLQVAYRSLKDALCH